MKDRERESVYESLLDRLIMEGRVVIEITEDFNRSTMRSAWARYKAKVMELPAMGELVADKVLTAKEEPETNRLVLTLEKGSTVPYKIVGE